MHPTTLSPPSWCYWCTEDRCVLSIDPSASASNRVVRVLDKMDNRHELGTVHAKCRYLMEHHEHDGHVFGIAERWVDWVSAPATPAHTPMCIMKQDGKVVVDGGMFGSGDRLFRIVLRLPMRPQ